ncbi:ECF-type sigma factor [Maioricimonas sp. JC845]|uniref:ECF-type sigma factor n=1 Tax=Maioricimonas sp. JC845 TaxID=3232138 RepID=UPI00345878B7
MSEHDREVSSVNQLVEAIAAGDEEAVNHLWNEYFAKLVRLSNRNLGDAPRRAAGSEDVALSAMHSFVKGAQDGRFNELDGRDELWKLLVTITVRKVARYKRRETAQKRGGGDVRGESVFNGGKDSNPGLDRIVGCELTPSLLTETLETCRLMLDSLGDDTLRAVAELRLEGYSNAEIASELGVSTHAVERKLALIKKKWRGRLPLK